MELTQGTRLIDDGARNYNGTQIEAAVDAVLENMRRGETIPEIILVTRTKIALSSLRATGELPHLQLLARIK